MLSYSRKINFYASTITLRDCLIALGGFLFGEAFDDRDILKYEKKFCEYLGARYTYSFWSGRGSLYGILKAMEIRENDEIIVQAYTCITVANAILCCGAVPIYVDIDPRTYNIDPEKLEAKINKRTKVIILQHTFGLPGPIDQVLAIAKKHGLKVIEDCAHSLGAQYKGKKVGTFGDAAFFSTEQSKVISTVTGGMAVTNDKAIGERLKTFQDSCSYPDTEERKKVIFQIIAYHVLMGPATYCWGSRIVWALHRRGFLFKTTSQAEIQSQKSEIYKKKLTNIQAKFGLNQLKNIDRFNHHRIGTAVIYSTRLRMMGLEPAFTPDRAKHIFLRYPLKVVNKEGLIDYAKRYDVEIGGWFESVLHPRGTLLGKAGYQAGSCPVAEKTVTSTVNLPTHPKVNTRDVEKILSILRRWSSNEV